VLGAKRKRIAIGKVAFDEVLSEVRSPGDTQLAVEGETASIEPNGDRRANLGRRFARFVGVLSLLTNERVLVERTGEGLV
jgi:hypothetical protein